MDEFEHLTLPVIDANLPRKKSNRGGGGYSLPEGRKKQVFAEEQIDKADTIAKNFSNLKKHFQTILDPNLIFEIKVNDSVSTELFEIELERMGLEVLQVAEDKRGYWVVFTSDENLHEFKKRIQSHGKDGEDGAIKYDFFNAIDGIKDIPIEEKLPPKMSLNSLQSDEDFYVDVEIWRMRDNLLDKFITDLTKNFKQIEITDKLIRNSFALIRIRTNDVALKKLLELKEVARVTQPKYVEIDQIKLHHQDVEDYEILSPADSACGILIIDSGIVSGHPLIRNALGDEENFQTGELDIVDKVGHGTAVTGCALYGNIEDCIRTKKFHAKNWIFSAKVMYSERNPISGKLKAVYDPKKLVEHQLQEAITHFLEDDKYKIRVVNLSLGNNEEIWNKTEKKQPPLASLIDEIAREYSNVVFVISSGNANPFEQFDTIEEVLDNYPEFLTSDDFQDFNLINPATSALALTVGSIAKEPEFVKYPLSNREKIHEPIAQSNQPSPFTRTGPGINGMIKPELTEYGGNLIVHEGNDVTQYDIGGKFPVLSHEYPDKLFNFDFGSSFSTPKIARCCALVANNFPDKSANFVKNLVLQSADYPEKFGKKFWNSDKSNYKNLMSMGYGVPDVSKAISSYSNRVLFFNEDTILPDKVNIFKVEFPDNFFQIEGEKNFSIVLTYDPPIRGSRGDYYLGNTLEFQVFHTLAPNNIISKITTTNDGQIDLSEVDDYKIDFIPKVTLRSKGCHQKAVKSFGHHSWKEKSFKSVCIALINNKRWKNIISDDDQQDYCISLYVYHSNYSTLYSELKDLNQVQVTERVRLR